MNIEPPPIGDTNTQPFHDWLYRSWEFYKKAGRLGDEQTWGGKNHYTNANDIRGQWPASLVVWQDNAVLPGGFPWAVTGVSVTRVPMPTAMAAVAGYFQAAAAQGGAIFITYVAP